MILLVGIRDIARKLLPSRKTSDPWIDPAVNGLHAYRVYGNDLRPLAESGQAGRDGLSTSLLQTPGTVSVGGASFALQEDGLYRFYRLNELSEQRIVCRGGLESMLQMLGYLWVYGNVDDALSSSELREMANSRRIVAGCGNLALLGREVLAMIGVTSRVVACMTAEQWGGQDDGHTLLEIRDPAGAWFAYDPTNCCCFRHRGQRLSLVEFSRRRGESYDLEWLPGNRGHGLFRTAHFDYGFWIDERAYSETRLRAWYSRVAGVPMVLHEGCYHYPESSIASSARAKFAARYASMTDANFDAVFYARF